ncbi:hypothetical protein AOLI_G00252270 [Acnodon oligacanthus]
MRLGIVTASSVIQQSFHLRVIDVNDAPECETQFQFPAPTSIVCTGASYLAEQVCLLTGVEVHVPEDVSPFKPLYTVPVRDLDENDTISASVSG